MAAMAASLLDIVRQKKAFCSRVGIVVVCQFKLEIPAKPGFPDGPSHTSHTTTVQA
jgi:hypothetical protein